MSKKIISFILISVLVLSTLFCGCGEKTEKIRAGVLIYKYDDTYISSVRKQLQTLADQDKDHDVELVMNDGKGDQGTQNDQIDTMIEKNVDVLLVNMVDVGAAETVLTKIKSAGIPVIFFNREPDSNIIKTYDKATFIGTNASDAGVIQGKIITDAWKSGNYDTNGDGVMQYVMFQGEPDNPEAVARTEYSVKTVEENGIKTKEIAKQVCNWQIDLAQNAMEAWLSKFGNEIEVVFANNDDMARGAVAALQAQGYNKGGDSKMIPVVGVDATEPAKELIEEGAMTGSVIQDANAMADAVYKVLINKANGKDAIDGTDLSYDSTGVAVRIPYAEYVGK